MNRTLLKKYARLIVRTGVNVQKGMPVVVVASVEQKPLVIEITREAYRCGAKSVRVEWQCNEVSRLAYQHEMTDVLAEVKKWQKEKWKDRVETLPCMIYIESDDPDVLAGVSQEKIRAVQQNRQKLFKPYRDAMDNRYPWVIVAAASRAWAKKVFPDKKPAEAENALWDAILSCCHVTAENDPVEEWKKINESFRARCAWLNRMNFTAMEYSSSNGTHFLAGLINGVLWEGGGESDLSGHYYNPNMPTEEIFTSPMRGAAEGTLVSTKPLSWGGQLIENFSITFEHGKAVSWTAEKGKETLDQMLTMDEGGAMLGELALVPKSSPISQSGVLFYNTLFDENASCHVAVGRGFTNLVPGWENMTQKELIEKGINDSLIHVDFMIGSDDLCITGIRGDGTRVPVFVNGDWAAEI